MDPGRLGPHTPGTRFASTVGMRFVLLLACVAACGGEYATGDLGAGGDGGQADVDAGGPDFAMRVSPLSAELVLGETRTFTVEVRSLGGFAGPVALTMPSLPASWQAELAGSVTVPADGVASVELTITIPTDAEATQASWHVDGTGAPGTRSSLEADVLVKPELVIHIPPDAKNQPEISFGPANGIATVRFVAPGTRITWVNDDSEPHRIHANDISAAAGFPHQQEDLMPGDSYSVTINAPGEHDYGCHIHSQMVGKLIVQ
jgi:plastocyanin